MGWLLISIFLYAYCLHHFLVAELYWAIGADPYWFRYPYFIAQNSEFYQSWFLHCVFTNVYLISVLLFLAKSKKENSVPVSFPFFPTWVTFGFTLVALFCFVYLWFPWLKVAFEQCSSLYLTFKKGEPLLGKMYVFSRALLSLSSIGICFLVLIPILVRQKRIKPCLLLASAGLAIAFFVLCATLGDKHALLGGLVFTVVFSSFWNPKAGRLILTLLVGVIFINWISLVRHRSSLIFCAKNETVSMPLEDAILNNRFFGALVDNEGITAASGSRILRDNAQLLVRGGISLLDHGETVTVFSTYALLRHKVPVYNGQSIKFLAASLLPKFLGFPRPEHPQDYFSRNTAMNEITGWGLNYFTDWLMNFGFIGGVMGALILSAFHSCFFSFSQFSVCGKIGFASIVSSLPFFLRSGLHFKEPFQVMVYASILFLFLPGSLQTFPWFKYKRNCFLLRRLS